MNNRTISHIIKAKRWDTKREWAVAVDRKWERDIPAFLFENPLQYLIHVYNIFLPPSSFHQVRSVWE